MARGYFGLRTITDGKKVCRTCQVPKPVARFRTRNAERGWLQPSCRDCENADNLKRTRGKKVDLCGGEPTNCYLCGDEIDWDTAEIDRINPRANGGQYVKGNCAWACRPCNQLKNGFPLPEFLARTRKIADHLRS